MWRLQGQRGAGGSGREDGGTPESRRAGPRSVPHLISPCPSMNPDDSFLNGPWFGEPPAFVYLLGAALVVMGPLVAAFLLAT